jgi:hypothetical protein
MKVYITIASDWDYEEVREIQSLEALDELRKEFNYPRFVLDFRPCTRKGADMSLIVYDDYIE